MNLELLGIKIDSYDFEEAINYAMSLIRAEKVSQVVTINPEMFARAEKDENFAQIIENAEMVIPDGVGVKIALNLIGEKAVRIPGIDFAFRLLQECAKDNIPVGIVGAKEDVISKAVEYLKKEIKNLNIVYYHNGYFEHDSEVYEGLKYRTPRLVLVAMGSPRQEEFSYNAKKVLSDCLMVGIGGSLDVWSGTVKRAPLIFRKLGLEWFYRTVTQPKRLKRIFPTLPLFLIKVLVWNSKRLKNNNNIEKE